MWVLKKKKGDDCMCDFFEDFDDLENEDLMDDDNFEDEFDENLEDEESFYDDLRKILGSKPEL